MPKIKFLGQVRLQTRRTDAQTCRHTQPKTLPATFTVGKDALPQQPTEIPGWDRWTSVCFFTFVCAIVNLWILKHIPLSPPLDSIRVTMIVWRLRANIIRTALFWIVWHNVHSQQHTNMSSSYRSNRLGLCHIGTLTLCLELYYCKMVEWFWWESSLISMTSWFPSVLWHRWFGHLVCKNRSRNEL